jgi:hypothetical protein
MEIRDGFIISVFNYCDRWCEWCTLTSHCRLFAHVTGDAASGAVPRLEDFPPAPPKWIEDVFEEMNAFAGGPLTHDELSTWQPPLSAAHQELYERAKAYCVWAHSCIGRLGARRSESRHDVLDPVAVILWFSSLNASTIRRALTGLAEFDGYRDVAPDHEGAAKVALVGIERSSAAWHQLVLERRLSAAQARPCLQELEWLRNRLEAAIPGARAFVRPGFDEPETVALLQAAGRRAFGVAE